MYNVRAFITYFRLIQKLGDNGVFLVRPENIGTGLVSAVSHITSDIVHVLQINDLYSLQMMIV